MTGPGEHPPGWYDDGATPGVVRWFDGTGWTENTRPVVAAIPVAPVPTTTELYAHDSAYGQPVGFGAPVLAASTPTGGSFGAYESRFASVGQAGARVEGFGQPTTLYAPAPPLGRLVDEGAIRSARRTTLWSVAVGIGALVVGGVLAILRARALQAGLVQSSDRAIATSGLISAGIAFVQAGRSYRVMVDQGGDRWTPAGKTLVFGTAGFALVLALAGVAQVTRAALLPPLGPAVAGSCWTDTGADDLLQVRCSEPHDYVGNLVTRDSTGAGCPPSSVHVLLSLDDGTGSYLCLDAAVPAGL